ncbi:related to gamma-glutamyltranspeptidase [Zygosaccharomyces bailii]|nr:related to gamma-glutamyltranspeptidase [Zygosaccharomyces bailii]
MSFNSSRRSVVHSTKGIVTSTQPLASAAGAKILEMGGNSVDASVAVASCLCVMEPASTGIGGDCFMLHYDNISKEVIGLNGTGRSPLKLTRNHIIEENKRLGRPDSKRIHPSSVHSVTVPGTVAGWIDAVKRYGSGRVDLEQILQPAIDLCEHGHPISEISSILTTDGWNKLQSSNKEHLLSCFSAVSRPLQPPQDGDLVVNRPLSRILKKVAQANSGKAFYEGEVARGIVDEIQSRGGLLTMEDLKNHSSTFVKPMYLDFLGARIWEIPPNSQGLVVLIALGIIKELHNDGTVDLFGMEQNSVGYLHLLIECLKLAFHDVDEYVGDPDFNNTDNVSVLLSPDYLSKRALEFNPNCALKDTTGDCSVPDPVLNQSDTVYFTVSDPEGNATSFINSVYTAFGSAIIPETLGGFCLQNRGANFNLLKGSRNCIEGGKRPYHTIIPAMITDPINGELLYSLGNMGGFMQPTGHVQHFLNLMLFNLSPQDSLDRPRICLSPHPDFCHLDRGRGGGGPVSNPVTQVEVEEDLDANVIAGLRKLGHDVRVIKGYKRALFGRGQIIKKTITDNGFVYSAGTDKRGDGIPIPLL